MCILIKDALILTMEKDDNGSIMPPFRGNLGIKGQKIAEIGDKIEQSYCQVIDGKHLLAMPGLINTHGHSVMSLFRGYADDLDLMDWLNNKIFPIEAKLTAEDAQKGSRLAILEMLKSGTTTYADMYFFMEEVAEAVMEGGIRASLCEGMTSSEKLKISLNLAQKYQGSGEGRLSIMLGPHAPYTCSEDFLAQVAEEARKYYLPVHIHLAETLNENRQIEEAYGCRPLAYLQKAGLLDGIKLLAAHGVWLNQDEIELLAEVEASVAHNPCSNMKLASGIAPVGDMLAAKLNVSLGTDSACSNNNLDMFQEMRTAAYLGKIKNLDPKALPAGEILSMATVNGAEALGLYDVGTLSVGKKADLILLNTDTPHFTPVFDWVSHLVYAASGSDVDSVIVDGRLVVEKRKALYLDEEKIIYEAENAAQRLLSAL